MTTLADVAKRANVSKMTVSRVLNHPEQVTEELKALVHQAMKELDYRPNVAAKALVSNRSQVIKVYILEEIDTTEPYFMYLLMGIAAAVGKTQYSLQLVTSELADQGNCDGYIITGFRRGDFEWIKALDKPVILFGENTAGFDFVDSDNRHGTRNATKYAHSRGYQRLIYIGIAVDEPFELSRESGYLEVMKDLGLAPEIHRFENRSTVTENFIAQHFSELGKDTCFICSSDRLALGVERGLLQQGGKVPEEFGIIGFDGVFLDQVSSPKLTTCKQAIVKMGETCGELLVKKINEEGAPQGIRRFLPVLEIRESTR